MGKPQKGVKIYPAFQSKRGVRKSLGKLGSDLNSYAGFSQVDYKDGNVYRMEIYDGDLSTEAADTTITHNGKILGDHKAHTIETDMSKYGYTPYKKTDNFDKYKEMFIKSFNNSKNARYYNNVNNIQLKQQGGTMNQQQGIEQQVIQLVQAAAAGDQKATQQIEQIMQAAQKGDQQAVQIAQIIQKVVEAMKQQSGIKARLGAKLSYINKLKGICPEGTEKVYMAKGGCMCKKVAKNQNGGDTDYSWEHTEGQKNHIKKYKKAMKNAKDEAARDSIAINDFGDSVRHEEVGHKGKFNPNKENKVGGATWEPDRSQYKTEKKACGSKLKKRK